MRAARFDGLGGVHAGLARAGMDGGACRIRTCDHLIKSQMLYQLS